MRLRHLGWYPVQAAATGDRPRPPAEPVAGRLTPEHTPEGVSVTGNVSLEDLRKGFPGY